MGESELFGKYVLERRLAFGGMAEIFLARMQGDRGFAKTVVLKRILPQYGSDQAFVEMFIDEAVIAARLTHPNITQVYDFGDVDGVFFIAMEWVDGVDLRRVLRAVERTGLPLSFAEIAAIGEGVSRGLSYAHSVRGDDGEPLGIIHRDISPHNIMISRAGEAKVMDFGIAKARARSTNTATGMIKGKLAYMPPEQASAEELDARADQFALGVVLWECITGARLFAGDSDLELLRKVIRCEVPDPRTVRADVPDPLAEVVLRALQADRSARFEDMAAMEHALSAFRFSLGEGGVVRLGDLVDRSAHPARSRPQTRALPEAPAAPSPPSDSAGSGSTNAPAMPAEDISLDTTRLRADRAATGWTEPPATAELTSTETAAPTFEAGGHDGAAVSPTGDVAPAPVSTTRRLWGGAIALLVVGISLGVVALGLEPPDSSATGPRGPTGIVRVVSEPAGASIWVDGADAGLRTPATLPGQPLGSELDLSVHLPGHKEIDKRLVVAQAEEEVKFVFPSGEPPPAPAATGVVEAAVAKPPPEPRPVPKTPKASERRRRRQAAAVGEGTLSMRSSGAWYDVYLGDRHLGTTPLSRVRIPAGTHRLRLVNPETGQKRALEVTIREGQELRKTVGR